MKISILKQGTYEKIDHEIELNDVHDLETSLKRSGSTKPTSSQDPGFLMWSPWRYRKQTTNCGDAIDSEMIVIDSDDFIDGQPWHLYDKFHYFAHTTHRHQSGDPKNEKWRVIVKISRPLTTSLEVESCMRYMGLTNEMIVERLDKKTGLLKRAKGWRIFDTARSFFLPPSLCPMKKNTGETLDVDKAVSWWQINCPTESKTYEWDTTLTKLTEPGKNLMKRIEAYIENVPGAIQGNDGSGVTISLACKLTHGFLLNEKSALYFMKIWNERCEPQWSDWELRHKISDAIKWLKSGRVQNEAGPGWLLAASNNDKSGTQVASNEHLVYTRSLILESIKMCPELNSLSGDSFSHEIVWLQKPTFTSTFINDSLYPRRMNEADVTHVMSDISRTCGISSDAPRDKFDGALLTLGEERTTNIMNEMMKVYHNKWLSGPQNDPFDGFLEKYVGWDPTRSSPFTKEIFKMSFVATIRRACFNKPYGYGYTIVLTGRNYLGKTTMLQNLCPPGDYYVQIDDELTPNSKKDFMQSHNGKVWVTYDELSSFVNTRLETLNSILAAKTFNYRPSYGRKPQDFPKTFTEWGTANDDNPFLARLSSSGALRRRIVPINVTGVQVNGETRIDFEGISNIRDELWGYAYHLALDPTFKTHLNMSDNDKHVEAIKTTWESEKQKDEKLMVEDFFERESQKWFEGRIPRPVVISGTKKLGLSSTRRNQIIRDLGYDVNQGKVELTTTGTYVDGELITKEQSLKLREWYWFKP